MAIASDQGWSAEVGKAILATRQAAGVAFAHDVAFNAETLVLPDGLVGAADAVLSDTVGPLAVDTTLAFDRAWERSSVESDNPVLEGVDVRKLAIAWGELDLSGSGALAADAEGYAEGRIELRARNWRTMLDVAEASGALNPTVASGVRAGLGLLAGFGGDADSLSVPLELRRRPHPPRPDPARPGAAAGASLATSPARPTGPNRNIPLPARYSRTSPSRSPPMSAPHHIPLAEIDAAALDRDRTHVDAAALMELRLSIATHGLRMPIEVYALPPPEPRGPHRYGLISGFRRLAAVRALAETARDKARFAAIAAFLRAPKDAAEVYVQMVEENAIRAEVSPWEQAMVAVKSARAEAHAGIDAAIEAALRQPQPPEARPPAQHRPPRRRPRRLPDRPRDPVAPPAPPSRAADPPRLRRPPPRHPRRHPRHRPRRRMARPAARPPRSRTPRARDRPRPPRPPAPRPRPPPPRPHHPPRAHPARLGPALHRPQRHQRHARLRLRRDRAPVQPARAPRPVEAPAAETVQVTRTRSGVPGHEPGAQRVGNAPEAIVGSRRNSRYDAFPRRGTPEGRAWIASTMNC